MAKVILGAGLSGLSAAFYHLKRFPENALTILETTGRPGGWLKTLNRGGVIFEQGPRSIRPRGLAGANTLQLIEEIGLADKIIAVPSHHPAASNRMIYVNGKLYNLPSSFTSIFRKQPPFSQPLYKYILNFLSKPKKHVPDKDESLYSFVSRRFGEDVAEYAISPLVCGICAGDAKEISVRFLMESLFEKEQKYSTILRGFVADAFSNFKNNKKIPESALYKRAKNEKWNIYTFQEGIEVLPKTLEKYISEKNNKIQYNTKCVRLEKYHDCMRLHLENGTQIQAKYVVSSLPATALGDLLKHQHPTLASLLKTIPYVTVAVVNLMYDTQLDLKEGFGFLVPPKENIPILGVIFDSCCFSYHAQKTHSGTQLTVMLGGRWFDKYFSKKCNMYDIYRTTVSQLKDMLNISTTPATFNVSILKDCIPQYTVGHKKRIEEIEAYIKANKLPLHLCGSSYYGVGINDVILSAKEAVNKIPM